MCMQRQDRRELLPFDPEPEWTLHQLRKEARTTQFEIMHNQEDEGQFQERNEPQVDQNRLNYRDQATRSFVQPDNLHMLLEEIALPLTIVQSAIQRPPLQGNKFELKGVTLQMLHNIQFHGLPSENPNAHLTRFIEVCDTVKYNGGNRRSSQIAPVPTVT